MFCRVESGFRSEFSDPAAARIHSKISKIHPSLAEKIRWIRKLRVVWMEFDAPRDKVVQSIQQVFKNKVTDWVFTGDLLPSAAGATGTLYDLMQESPFRPGIFHGIEKRKRLSTHDEESLVLCDAIQTVLGRASPGDRVVSGELLLLEGVKLIQSDLEWVARNWFAHEKYESWTLLSEEELKRNSRFQAEQVAKYLAPPNQAVRSRLLQFRAPSRPEDLPLNWPRISELLRTRIQGGFIPAPVHAGDDWNFISDIRFSSDQLLAESLSETEFQLCRHQLDHFAQHGTMRFQSVSGVLPDKNRLWRSEIQGEAPLKVRDDFEKSIERVAASTNTPVAVMKVIEEDHEGAPAYFMTGGVSLFDPELKTLKARERGSLSDLIYVGDSDPGVIRNLTLMNSILSAYRHGIRGEAVDFAIHASGKSLLRCLKDAKDDFQYGFDLVIDGIEDWFKSVFESPMSMGFIWGVNPEKRDWLSGELRTRGIPFKHFGCTSLTGDVRILEHGRVQASATIREFFQDAFDDPHSRLLEEPVFIAEKRRIPAPFRNRFSTEELILKPEEFRAIVPSPVVLQPSLDHWSGLMVLTDLVEQGFDRDFLDFIMRKCTAMGGQVHSVQASYLNGLKDWSETLRRIERDYGIPVTELEFNHHPGIQAHWLGLQVVAKVADVRTVRTEEFKFPNDRIYWLSGDFEQAGTRWLSGFEGRYQGGLHSAVAIESKQDDLKGVTDALCFALKKRRLGAEVRIQHRFSGGFFVSVSETERFAVEEEWRVLGVGFEFVGRVTNSPYLVVRDESDHVETLSIEDLV
ncbi:MAG: hypothetical protein EBX52_01280 [Proteobacteria bacterium]|nr:hypothetical protein [Pseudomonadota bacterium]